MLEADLMPQGVDRVFSSEDWMAWTRLMIDRP
jgi:hypothetical protein